MSMLPTCLYTGLGALPAARSRQNSGQVFSVSPSNTTSKVPSTNRSGQSVGYGPPTTTVFPRRRNSWASSFDRRYCGLQQPIATMSASVSKLIVLDVLVLELHRELARRHARHRRQPERRLAALHPDDLVDPLEAPERPRESRIDEQDLRGLRGRGDHAEPPWESHAERAKRRLTNRDNGSTRPRAVSTPARRPRDRVAASAAHRPYTTTGRGHRRLLLLCRLHFPLDRLRPLP